MPRKRRRRFQLSTGSAPMSARTLPTCSATLQPASTTFACRCFDGRIPAEGEPGLPEHALAQEIERRIVPLTRLCHERLAFRHAAARPARFGRGEQLPPGASTVDDDQIGSGRAPAVTTRTGLNLLALCAAVSWSIIPTLASRVLAAFSEPDRPPWPAGPPARHLASRKGQPIARIGRWSPN